MEIVRTEDVLVRCQQRGIRETDLDIIVKYGTQTPDGFLVTGRDIAKYEQNPEKCKKISDRLSKLNRTFLPANDNTAKTIFRASKKQMRKQTRLW